MAVLIEKTQMTYLKFKGTNENISRLVVLRSIWKKIL